MLGARTTSCTTPEAPAGAVPMFQLTIDDGSGDPPPLATNVASGSSDPLAISLEPFERQFRDFWHLPESWVLTEDELDVPTYGSKFRMDLSKMLDVKTVVLVEE